MSTFRPSLSNALVRATCARSTFSPSLALRPVGRRFEASRPPAAPTPSTPAAPPSQRSSPRIPTQAAVQDSARVGGVNWKAAVIFTAAGAALYTYFINEKAKMVALREKQAAAKSTKTGKPLIGGPFSLLDQDGNEFTEQDLLGHWTLMYFGFTNCPDICPEELDKMTEVVEMLDAKYGPIARPLFVSCDPARDTIPQVKKYVSEFHPRTIGLTGPYEAVKHMCKVFRVYFSTPPNAKPTDDYLVDHSIYFYLLDPDGTFCEAFGKDASAPKVVEKIEEALAEWKEHARIALSLKNA